MNCAIVVNVLPLINYLNNKEKLLWYEFCFSHFDDRYDHLAIFGPIIKSGIDVHD